jgi:hypothetical protein
MSEILEMTPVETIQPEEMVKPYTFRTLSTVDVFPMFKIISSIGINEFMMCLESDSLKNVINMLTNKEESEDDVDNIIAMGAIAGFLEIANVIMGNIGKCEKDIYQLLSQTSNLSIEQVKGLDMVTFFEMVIDFIKKDEFKDFIKVVSKLFK